MTAEQKREKVIKEIMRDAECSREDAEYVYELEQKEKEQGKGRHYNKSSTKTTERTPRERKPDDDKRFLINKIEVALADLSPTTANAEREITFNYNGAEYSVVLTKHRPPKK